MENKILAIEGHPTRYKEVIEVLEMLGAKMKGKIIGNGLFHVYYINSDGNIDYTHFSLLNDAMIFTLEEFLAKYPYKVGDMVQHKGSTSCGTIYIIEKMVWEDNQIKYIVHHPWSKYSKCTIIAKDLQPYKEEIYMNNTINNIKTAITINGEKLIAPKGYTIKTATMNDSSLTVEYIKNKPQYPKNYEECCLITEKVAKTTHELDIAYNPYLIYDFQKLLICRDAYWKIAGEEMGLSEPWKPNWKEGKTSKYTIQAQEGYTWVYYTCKEHKILAFPTKEMRDAFYENFKDLIEGCKEFL